MDSEFFQGIMRWNVERNGTTRLLPYFYYDNLMLAAVFTASTRKVQSLIPHPDLHLIELTPGRCLIAFAAFEYRETTDSPYNEFNISFLVSYLKKPLPLLTLLNAFRSKVIPSYVWQLPVTEEFHRAGGVALFGYPKFIADIQFSKHDDHIECSLADSGSDILKMSGRVIPTKREKPIRYLTYALDNGTLVSANVLVNPLEYGESRRKADLILEIGKDHPICRVLHEIELANHPLTYQFSPRSESILFPGRNVSDL